MIFRRTFPKTSMSDNSGLVARLGFFVSSKCLMKLIFFKFSGLIVDNFNFRVIFKKFCSKGKLSPDAD